MKAITNYSVGDSAWLQVTIVGVEMTTIPNYIFALTEDKDPIESISNALWFEKHAINNCLMRAPIADLFDKIKNLEEENANLRERLGLPGEVVK